MVCRDGAWVGGIGLGVGGMGVGVGRVVAAGAHPAIPMIKMLAIKKKIRKRFIMMLLLEQIFIYTTIGGFLMISTSQENSSHLVK
jgi:hypothetical protein